MGQKGGNGIFFRLSISISKKLLRTKLIQEVLIQKAVKKK